MHLIRRAGKVAKHANSSKGKGAGIAARGDRDSCRAARRGLRRRYGARRRSRTELGAAGPCTRPIPDDDEDRGGCKQIAAGAVSLRAPGCARRRPREDGCRRAVLQQGVPDCQESGPDECLLLRHARQAGSHLGDFSRRGPECARRSHQALRSRIECQVGDGRQRHCPDRSGANACRRCAGRRLGLPVRAGQPQCHQFVVQLREQRRRRRGNDHSLRSAKVRRRPPARRATSSSICSPSRARSR